MKSADTKNRENSKLVENLIDLLKKGNAHVSLDDSLKNISFEIIGEKPGGLPYSLWQIVEHIRIAQSDILEFSRDSNYQSPEWPGGYWPKEIKPASEEEWKKCIDQIKKDRDEFIQLLQNSPDDLFAAFEHGDGQTLLREALVLADHNSYHTGEIIVLRRLLNDWPK